MPNLSSLLHPLHSLLRAGQRWQWSQECGKAFKEAKKLLVSASVLAHFNSNLPVSLAGDISLYGIGAVISHVQHDGTEQLIAFASHSLSTSERNYAQVDKEALALVFGIKKFHTYLYGRKFILLMDHKPLTTILGPKQAIPAPAAVRMQCWALLLLAYMYDIHFWLTQAHSKADGLSCLPLSAPSAIGNSEEPTLFNIAQLDALPIQASRVKAATVTDIILSHVLRFAKERVA